MWLSYNETTMSATAAARKAWCGMWRKITVLAPSFALMSTLTVSPALARIAEAFPDLSVSAVQLLNTIPFLAALPLILLSGQLASRFTKKRLLCAALILAISGGLMPLLFHDSYPLLVFSTAIFGLGFGIITPISTALVHEHYAGHEQLRMVGFQSAVIGLGGVCFTNIGGYLASLCWWYSYFAFFLLVPVLVLVLCLPKGAKDGAPPRMKGFFSPTLVFVILLIFFSSGLTSIFNTNLAMFIEQAGLGGPGTAGAAMSVFSIANIAGGVLAGWLISRMKNATLTLVFLISGLGYLFIYISPALAALFAAAFLYGFFFSLRMPAAFQRATMAAPPGAGTFAIAFVSAASYLGQFLSPFFINPLGAVFQPGAAVKFLLGAFLFAVLAAIALLLRRQNPLDTGKRVGQ